MIKHIYKIFFVVFIFFSTSFSNSLSDIIKDIKIFGNERVNNETIKIFGGIKKGDEINNDKLNDVLKKLYETNFFKDVNLKINNSILEITVDENPSFTYMDYDLMELNTLQRRALYRILEIIFGNPAYLNRDGQRLYLDYPSEQYQPQYIPTKFELERLRYVYDFLKISKQGVKDIAEVNIDFRRQMNILFENFDDFGDHSKLENQELQLLAINKGTDIEGLISRGLLDTPSYNFINNSYQINGRDSNCVQLFFGLKITTVFLLTV